MKSWPIAVIPGVTATVVMASVAPSTDRKAEAALPITMAYTSPDICTVDISGTTFTLPRDDLVASAALRDLARTHTSASIGGAADIPYRCIATVLYATQQAGFTRIGFVAVPPPPKQKVLRPR